jgi:hypothetical protein
MTLNTDAKFNGLARFGYTGVQEDRELQFYKANGVTSNNITDAESEFLAARGFTTGSVTDRWKAYLNSQGYNGSVDDMLPSWWKDMPGSSLSLDFTKPSLLTSQSGLDPRVTFTRTSNATVTDSTGTLVYAPHNLLRVSEQFDVTAAGWTTAEGSISANATLAPDGTQTADKYVENTALSAFHRIIVGFSAEAIPYTLSVHAKADGRNFIRLSNASDNQFAYFNVSTGALGTVSSGVEAVITPVSNGFYRCSITFTPASAATKTIGFNAAAVDNSTNYQGDGTSGIFLWGAQLNVGSLQPYYPTTRKNLMGFTQEFDNAAWTKTAATVTANTAVAPDGSMTADKLIATAGSATHFISQTYTAVVGTPLTCTAYLKAGEYAFARVVIGSTANASASFDLTNGTLFASSGANIVGTPTIISVGNGWYRCSATALPTAGGGGSAVLHVSNDGSTNAFSGNGVDGIFIWGAQLSDSASLDPYVYNPGAAPASTAYFGPRFDYDPVTLAPKGLLIEEQRTNLLLQSGWAGAVAGTPGTAPTSWAFNASGGQLDAVVPDAIGQNFITFSATANRQIIFQSVALAANTTYATTVVLLSTTGISIGEIMLAVGLPAGTVLTFRINGAAAMQGSVPVAGDKLEMLVAVAATAGSVVFRFGVGCSGNQTGTVTIGRPQLEAGAFATSYIPTTTAAATRAADVAVMTGANFSNWFTSASENTFFVEATKPQTNNSNAIALEGADVRGLTISVDGVGSRPRALVRHGTARYDSGGTAPVFTADALLKIAAGTSSGGSSAAFNGLIVAAASAPSQTDWGNELRIGNRVLLPSSTSNFWNGHIRRIAYYPRRLANAELQGITS